MSGIIFATQWVEQIIPRLPCIGAFDNPYHIWIIIYFRNIYNTNRLFNKKNEYPYKINCLTSCKNVYFHFILYSLPMRFCIESIRRMLSEAVARHPNYKQSPTNHTFIKNMSYAHLSDDSNVAIILSYVLKWLIYCW